jgi:hypothetical protein
MNHHHLWREDGFVSYEKASPLSSVRIAHTAQVYMVMGNAFSSREAVSSIKVMIWNEEPLMGFEMCLWEKIHISYM